MSAIEILAPILLCVLLVYMRSEIDHEVMPSIKVREVIYDENSDVGYLAVYHYPFVEAPRLDLTHEELWMETNFQFAGIEPRSRLFFIPKSCFWTGNYAT